MLVKALARPLVNTITKVPSRSTSAIVGRRTNNVSVTVSSREKIDSTFFPGYWAGSPQFRHPFQMIQFLHNLLDSIDLIELCSWINKITSSANYEYFAKIM